MDIETLSYFLSVISLVLYSIVYIPQFIVIFRDKSSDGMSLITLSVWTQADILSLIGTLILYMPVSIVVIGWYHFGMGICMMLFTVYYKPENRFLMYMYTIAFSVVNISVCVALQITVSEPHDTAGLILGWITTALYILGRIPQIVLNFKRKSTEGLSLLMYIFTMLANTIYAAILLLYPESFFTNLPWITACFVNDILDLFVLGQHYYYKNLLKDIIVQV